MSLEEIIGTLDQYVEELSGILTRFTKTADAIHIERSDGYRMREIVTELSDFIDDHVPNSRRHAKNIVDYYNYGIRNFSGSSSYSSVEEIKSTVAALIVRIRRNPNLLSPQEPIDPS